MTNSSRRPARGGGGGGAEAKKVAVANGNDTHKRTPPLTSAGRELHAAPYGPTRLPRLIRSPSTNSRLAAAASRAGRPIWPAHAVQNQQTNALPPPAPPSCNQHNAGHEGGHAQMRPIFELPRVQPVAEPLLRLVFVEEEVSLARPQRNRGAQSQAKAPQLPARPLEPSSSKQCRAPRRPLLGASPGRRLFLLLQ